MGGGSRSASLNLYDFFYFALIVSSQLTLSWGCSSTPSRALAPLSSLTTATSPRSAALDVGTSVHLIRSSFLTPPCCSPIRHWPFLCHRNHPRHFHMCSCVGGSSQSWYHYRSYPLQGFPSLEGTQIHCRPNPGRLRRVPRRLRPVPRPDQGPYHSPGS